MDGLHNSYVESLELSWKYFSQDLHWIFTCIYA